MEGRKRRSVRRGRRVVLGIVSAIAGSGLAIAMARNEAAAAGADASQGYVYVQLPRTEGVAPPRMSIQVEGKSTEFDLEQRDGGRPNEYGAWVPAGAYVPSDWQNFRWGDYQTFEVQPGRVTDLGTFVAVQLGGSRFVIVPVRGPEADDHVQEVVRALGARLSNPEPLVWAPTLVSRQIQLSEGEPAAGLVLGTINEIIRSMNEPPLSERLAKVTDAAEFLAIAKTGMPPLTRFPAVDADGTLYFGAALGQVRIRAPDGRWRSADTGTIERITALSVQGDALFAGSQNGGLLVSKDHGATWARLASIDERRDVRALDRVGQRWFVVATHPGRSGGKWESVDKVSVYSGEGATPESLRPVGEWDVDPDESFYMWVGPSVGVQSGTYFVNVMSQLVGINLTSLEPTTVKLPSPASGASISADGRLMSIFYRKGMFSKLHVSQNAGVDWTKRKAPPYLIEDVYFRDGETGVATRSNSGASTSTFEVFAYQSDKDSWEKRFEAPAGCVRLLWDASMQPSFCVLSGGSIVRMVDGTWRGEFAGD